MLKQLIRKILKRTGRVLKPYNAYEEQLALVRDKWLKEYGIRTVIDVGANNGWYAGRIRKMLPQAMIYSFEPLESPYKKLLEKFQNDHRFRAYCIACDTVKGSKPFFENRKSVSSSFLQMAELHKKSFPGTDKVVETVVQTDTLDRVFKSIRLESKVLLKLDVQGYELQVLKGAKELLGRVDLIFTEVSFKELYKEQALFDEISEFLKRFEFRIAGIEHVDRSLLDGASLQADVYYEKHTI